MIFYVVAGMLLVGLCVLAGLGVLMWWSIEEAGDE